ncbi:hypothetical protein LJR098_001051 [Rhizobium sp. LjRoot98]|uniref:hypothetical protein n=1 Tax=Rhizobium sp. LjRoot98 TaxID=3342345 RepID=UPI003ECE1834
MDADAAIEHWIDGEMSTKEVMVATGFRRYSDLYDELQAIRYDEEVGATPPTAEEDERAELEAEAWGLYQSWLAEEPGYLPTIVGMLKRKRRQNFYKFADAFNNRRRSMQREGHRTIQS